MKTAIKIAVAVPVLMLAAIGAMFVTLCYADVRPLG